MPISRGQGSMASVRDPIGSRQPRSRCTDRPAPKPAAGLPSLGFRDMFNVGAGELLVILLIALIVLGPDKLPETARKMGNVMGELRRMSSGFQNEMRAAMDEVVRPPLETVKEPEAAKESETDA